MDEKIQRSLRNGIFVAIATFATIIAWGAMEMMPTDIRLWVACMLATTAFISVGSISLMIYDVKSRMTQGATCQTI